MRAMGRRVESRKIPAEMLSGADDISLMSRFLRGTGYHVHSAALRGDYPMSAGSGRRGGPSMASARDPRLG